MRLLMTLDQIGESLRRIEHKLDTLIKALAEEEDERPELTLDGERVPGERDQSQGL
jgi:hypothetical protein